MEKKEEILQNKLKLADSKIEEIESIKKSQFEMLERVSGFTKEQAKEHLLKALDE